MTCFNCTVELAMWKCEKCGAYFCDDCVTYPHNPLRGKETCSAKLIPTVQCKNQSTRISGYNLGDKITRIKN